MKKRVLFIAVCLLPLLSVGQLSNTHIEANVADLPTQPSTQASATPKPKVVLTNDVYEQKKEAGTLSDAFEYVILGNTTPATSVPLSEEQLKSARLGNGHQNKSSQSSNPQCDCLVPVDGTFSIAEFTNGISPSYRNDDGSTAAKALPFTFCMYGTNYNQFFINTNGNITFGAGYGAFTSSSFPAATIPAMVAPFWADVDTRNAASGLVYYKITPTYVIVKWQQVGYFPSAADKVNTFQLIITDGADPILSNGANIAFCYGDMQWTTGSASGGSGGFGGTPATSGVNKGDGINFAQIGRFNAPGSTYNGTTASSGVSWLDNQSFFFSTCANTNIPPIVAGLNNCDTLKVCGPNDSLIVNALFLSPEAGQITTVTVNLNGTPNASVLSITNGNVAFAQILIYASSANYGNNVITFTATDNGIPAGITIINSNIFIDSTGVSALNPVINGTLGLCQGSPTTLSVTPTTYDSYLWSTGSNGTSISVTTPGTYWLTSTFNGCVKTNIATIVATPAPTFSYVGTPYCQTAANPTPTYGTNGAAGTFTSTPGLVINSTTGLVNLATSVPGTYTVTNSIPAMSGCPAVSATSSITITAVQVATFSYTASPYCQVGGVNPLPTYSGGAFGGTFTSTPAGLTLDANTGMVTASSTTPGTYTVTNTIPAQGGCPAATATASITITAAPVASFVYLGSPYCKNGTNPSPTYFGGGVAGTFTATPAGLVIVSGTGAVNLSASAVGTYTVTNTLAASGPCPPQTATATITITALPIGTFSYTGSPYCHGGGVNPAPTFSGGGVGGTFTFTPAGLIINSSTGVVNTSTSTPGTYTVTNTIAAVGGCPSVTATSSITIIPAHTADFSFVNDPYCQGGANPFPTLNVGATSGVYSGDPGLVINSSTGEVDLTLTPPGTYNVINTVPAQNGCLSVNFTAVINITTLPEGTFDYPGNPFCQSGTASANFIGNGQPGIFASSSPNLIVDVNTADIDLTNSLPGTYWVYNLLPASDGCPDVLDSTQVTVVLAPVSTFSYTGTPYCQSGTDPSPTFSGGGTAGTFTSTVGLVIDAVTGTVTLATSTAGIYTVTNTVTPTGCPAVSSTATITIDAPGVADFSYTGTPYCVTGTDPLPTFSGGGVAGTFTSTGGLVIDPVTGLVTLATTTPGTYTVTNTLATTNSCPSVIATTSITVASTFAATFSFVGTPYCQNGANPSPAFSGGGVAGNFTSTLGLVIDISTGVVDLALSTPGTYTVTNTIPGSGACPTVSAISTITINAALIGTFSYVGSPYCTGGTNPSPTFSGGGVAGTFSSTLGITVDAITGVVDLGLSSPGTYVVTNDFIASGGCPAVSATASITINTVAVATFDFVGNPFCQNTSNPSPTFSGGGSAGTFTFTPAGLIIDPNTGLVTLATSAPGAYLVTNSIAASGGCGAASDTATIIIVAPPVADFNYPGTPYCQAAQDPTVAFMNGGSGGTFTSTAGLVIDPVTGTITLATSTPGIYTVTNQINSVACGSVTSTASVTIIGTSPASFNYPATPYCQNAGNPSPTFTSGGVAGTFTAPAGLSIDPATGLVTLATSTPGVYMVTNTVTNSGCPTSVDSSSITITLAPDATFSYPGSPYCQGSGNPSPTLVGTAGTFSSTIGCVIDSVTGIVDIVASIPGTYTVTNTVAGGAGCAPAVSTTPITISLAPASTFSYISSPYCQNAPNPNPTYTLSGIAGTFSYIPAGLSINASTGTVNLLSSIPGTYTVTNVVTAAGCPSSTSSASITITANLDGTFSYIPATFCANATNPFPVMGVGATAGTFTATGGLVVDAVTGQVTLASALPGTYQVTNTIAANGGCPAVVVSSPITISAVADPSFAYAGSPFCATGTVSPSSVTSPGGTFTSTPGLVISAGGVINLVTSAPGAYTITYVTSPASCQDSSTQQIVINPLPSAYAGLNQVLACGAGTVTLTGTGSSGSTYTWTPSANVVSGGNTLTAVVNASGMYTLTVTDNVTGCVKTSTVNVTSTAVPVANFTANPTAGTPPLIVNFTNTGTGAASYTWLFPGGSPNTSGAANPTVTYNTTGTYTVTLIAISAGGCVDTTSETIIVFDGYTLLIPNVFSPNSDLTNDYFTVLSTGVASFSGQIYDRWGLKMYDWTDVTKGWDGVNLQGSKALDGTYYYIITSKGFDGTDHTDQGFFMLVR